MARKSLKNLILLAPLVSLVIGVTLTTGCTGTEPETPPQETPTQIVRDVIPQAAFTLIQENQDNPDFVILDVQSPEEFAAEHIENAINVDYSSEPLRDALDRLDKNKTYPAYPRSGCNCSAKSSLSVLMEELNFREAYIIADGITAWRSAGFPTASGTPTQIIEDITPQEAFILIQENQDNPDFVILDVQAPEHFAGGHIENAINIDYYSEAFRDKLDKLDKSKTYLVYYTCHCGGVDTGTLAIMTELNFREVYNISDGLISWKSAGFPTVKN